jgi:hypothetical protein
MTSEERLRRFLLIVAAAIFAGTIVELLLIEHTEEVLQIIPLAVSAAGLAVVVGVLVAQRRALLRALRIVMVVTALAGLVGVGLHLKNNIEFELEIKPGSTVTQVLWKSLHGASPILASGILVVAAALATAATWRFESR